jgi:hypothetical protein
MSRIVLGGAIDLHCHFGPESVVGRKHAVDPFEAARDAVALDFKALVLKSHDFPTNSFAYAVTHAMNSGAGPGLSIADCVGMAELGAHVELAVATCMAGHGPAAPEVVRAIDAIGSRQVVLSTDYGWSDELPRPAIGLHDYVDALWQAGAKEAELREMACDNPARLLRLDA